MENAYKDDPKQLERWIENLTPREQDAFDKGYVAALCGLLEQISDSKRKILVKLMDVDDEDKLQLLSRLLILDTYEEHYEARVNNITMETPTI